MRKKKDTANTDIDEVREDDEKPGKFKIRWAGLSVNQHKFIYDYTLHGDMDRSMRVVGITREKLDEWRNRGEKGKRFVKYLEQERAKKQTQMIKLLEEMAEGERKTTERSFNATKEWVKANCPEYQPKEEKRNLYGVVGIIAIPMQINPEAIGLKTIPTETIDMTNLSALEDKGKNGNNNQA